MRTGRPNDLISRKPRPFSSRDRQPTLCSHDTPRDLDSEQYHAKQQIPADEHGPMQHIAVTNRLPVDLDRRRARDIRTKQSGQNPSGGPQAGHDPHRNRSLHGRRPGRPPIAAIADQIPQRQQHRRREIEEPTDAGSRNSHRHRQCPFSYARSGRPRTTSRQTALTKKTALTVRRTKKPGTLASAFPTSPLGTAPTMTGTSTAGRSIT